MANAAVFNFYFAIKCAREYAKGALFLRVPIGKKIRGKAVNVKRPFSAAFREKICLKSRNPQA